MWHSHNQCMWSEVRDFKEKMWFFVSDILCLYIAIMPCCRHGLAQPFSSAHLAADDELRQSNLECRSQLMKTCHQLQIIISLIIYYLCGGGGLDVDINYLLCEGDAVIDRLMHFMSLSRYIHIVHCHVLVQQLLLCTLLYVCQWFAGDGVHSQKEEI